MEAYKKALRVVATKIAAIKSRIDQNGQPATKGRGHIWRVGANTVHRATGLPMADCNRMFTLLLQQDASKENPALAGAVVDGIEHRADGIAPLQITDGSGTRNISWIAPAEALPWASRKLANSGPALLNEEDSAAELAALGFDMGDLCDELEADPDFELLDAE